MLNIYAFNGQAFVRTGPNEMLCIGTLAEVSGTTPEQVARMVAYAAALHAFRSLDSTSTRH